MSHGEINILQQLLADLIEKWGVCRTSGPHVEKGYVEPADWLHVSVVCSGNDITQIRKPGGDYQPVSPSDRFPTVKCVDKKFDVRTTSYSRNYQATNFGQNIQCFWRTSGGILSTSPSWRRPGQNNLVLCVILRKVSESSVLGFRVWVWQGPQQLISYTWKTCYKKSMEMECWSTSTTSCIIQKQWNST